MEILDAFKVSRALRGYPFSAKLRWYRQLRRWQKRIRSESMRSQDVPEVTAIILSFRRPQNIRPIVKMLLRIPEIRRIVVSNNNPSLKIEPYLHVQDSRVQVIEQPIKRPTHIRAQLALLDDADAFLFLDDDVFFTPEQIRHLLRELKKNPSVPHGVIGQIYDPWMDRMHHNVCNHEGPVDVLNCIYAVTREHLQEFFRIVDVLGITPDHPLISLSSWDDLVLSRSGITKPLLHRVGPFYACPTTRDPTIAASGNSAFFRFRIGFFKRLQKLKPLS